MEKIIGEKVEEMVCWAKEAYPKFVKEFGVEGARNLVLHDAYVMKITGNLAVSDIEDFLKNKEGDGHA